MKSMTEGEKNPPISQGGIVQVLPTLSFASLEKIICFHTDVVTPQFNVCLSFSSGKGNDEKLAIAAEGVERADGRY